MKNHLLKTLKFIIGWPLTLIALFFIAKFIIPNIFTILTALKNIAVIPLVIGILCIVVYFFIRSFFWQELLLQKDIAISLKDTTWFWGSAELRRYVPGNIWSLVGRASNFSQKNVSKSLVLSSSLLEAEFIVVSSLFVSLLSINFIIYGLLPNFSYKPLTVVCVTLLSLLFIFCFLANSYILKFFKLKHSLTFGKWKLDINFLPHFSFKTNLKLLLIQSIALFFFGLGTYFSISSFILLYPLYITTFIGFFVFSLFIGYVSIITPMGLGIREGIMTAGLTKFITVSLAGFSALFARFVFILAELCFLLLAYYWYKGKHKVVLSIEKLVKKNWPIIIVCLVSCLYILYMTTASFLRYDNFYAGRFDLGNMDQTVWNTLHGRIFQTTDPNGTNIMSRLAFHADFILILLAPFYLLWQDPKMLLLLQTVIVSCGGIFVYLIGKDIVKSKKLALLFSIGYFINPAVNYTNLYDFHGVTLATAFLLGAFYFLQKKKWFLYCIFLILAGLTKEEVWLITAFFGLYTIFTTRSKQQVFFQRLLGISITIISLFFCFFLVLYAIPQAKGGAHFALAYYSDFGSSPSEIIKSIILKPQKTVLTIFQPGQLGYLFELFSPLGFFSLFSPLFLLFTVPDLSIDLLSSNPALHQLYYQYSASITPFIFISAMYGFMIFVKRFPKLRVQAIYYLLLTILLNAYFFCPLPGSKHPNLTMFDSPQPYADVIGNFLDGIPKRYSIAATNNVGSHLSHRQEIFTIPIGINKADIIIFLLNDPAAQPSLAAQKKMAETMKQNKNYIEVFKQGDFIVFEKRNLYIQKEPNATHARLFPLSLPSLQHRDYIGGVITIEKKLEEKSFATKYLISYPSDGLKLYALMEIPHVKPTLFSSQIKGLGLYPILIINHDITQNKSHDTITTDTSFVDYFARKGFLVIKPDYRGVGNSEADPTSLAPLAYSADALNLISSLKTIPEADTMNVFLWGQRLGGEVTLKTLEVAGDNADTTIKNAIKGAVVWSPSTDPSQWGNDMTMYDSIVQNFGSSGMNPLFWQSISVKNYLDDIKAPVEIDQGTADSIISYTSSIELYNDLVSFNKNAKLRLFSNDTHDFSKYRTTVLDGNVNFFKKLISPSK